MATEKTTSRKGIGGRPRIVWNDQQWAAFDSMCVLTDKRHRVAVAMGYAEQTIDRLVQERHKVSFLEYLCKRFEDGNFKLLAKQYESAMNGNTTMLIWLGKQRLEQSDMTRTDLTSGGKPLPERIEVVLVDAEGEDDD